MPRPSFTTAIEYARRFKWGYDNYVGGTDDWRCANMARFYCGDDDDPMCDDYEPCGCAECEGATFREWNRGKPLPLAVRVGLNLANSRVSA